MKKYSLLMIFALIGAQCSAKDGVLSWQFKQNVLSVVGRCFCLMNSYNALAPMFKKNESLIGQLQDKVSNLLSLDNKNNVVNGLAWASLAGLGLLGPVGDTACCGCLAYKAFRQLDPNIKFQKDTLTQEDVTKAAQQVAWLGGFVGASAWSIAHALDVMHRLLN